MSGEVEADGVRDTDLFFTRSIDRLVDELLAEKKIPHRVLPAGQREAWAQIAADVVRDAPEMRSLF